MDFLKSLKSNMNQTHTLNGADALKTTDSKVLDLFGVMGALRNRNETEIENLFSAAYSENPLLAMKLLFYARDIRGGLGERRVPRILYRHLCEVAPEVMRMNLRLIHEYGRWDDLMVFLDTDLQEDTIAIIREQLAVDLKSSAPSLLAKWLPSINTSSVQSRQAAKKIISGLGMDNKTYRKTLAKLRKKIDVIEVKMSAQNWTEINYSHVPSNAMHIYSKAFLNRDENRFRAYIEAVKKGTEKINASVLYPYNITETILYHKEHADRMTLEEQWKNLPDYIQGSEKNILVMADVSGSMTGRPMATSIGLALYFAQRSTGMFANHFMTFSQEPELLEVTGRTLYEQVRRVLSAPWGMNTDFEKALSMILYTAIKGGADQSEMPETLIVVTDMEFDRSLTGGNPNWTFYQKMKAMYQRAGYKIPEIVFWNVNSHTNVFQVSSNYEGVKMASGQSASVFKSILESKAYTPYDFMMEVLGSDRYEKVAV